jgi:hypothetical protein
MERFQALHEFDFWTLLLACGLAVVVGQAAARTAEAREWARRAFFTGFVLYCVGGALWVPSPEAVAAGIIVRGLLAGGVAFGAAALAVSSGVWTYRNTLGVLLKKARWAAHERRVRREHARRLRDEERRRREARLRWELDAPKRERERLAAEERARLAAAEQIRRENARAECERAYARHAPEIKDRFPHDRLEHFLRTYMRDERPADEVESRGRELIALVEHHKNHVQPPRRELTLADVSKWYLEQKAAIESLGLPALVQEEQLLALEERYDEVMQDVHRRMRP